MAYMESNGGVKGPMSGKQLEMLFSNKSAVTVRQYGRLS